MNDGRRQARGWSGSEQQPTTVVLVRHGVTAHTKDKRFSGGLGGRNPALSDEGRAQAAAAAGWLAPVADEVSALVASPVRRTRETADVLADRLGREVIERPAFAEIEFGRWEGLTFAEVRERYPEDMKAWFGSLDVPPGGGGESFRQVQERVLAGLHDVVAEHPGGTVVVVSHVTPIKVLVAQAIGAPLESLYRMELSPASLSVLAVMPGVDTEAPGGAWLRLFNALPGSEPFRLR